MNMQFWGKARKYTFGSTIQPNIGISKFEKSEF